MGSGFAASNVQGSQRGRQCKACTDVFRDCSLVIASSASRISKTYHWFCFLSRREAGAAHERTNTLKRIFVFR